MYICIIKLYTNVKITWLYYINDGHAKTKKYRFTTIIMTFKIIQCNCIYYFKKIVLKLCLNPYLNVDYMRLK